MGTAARQSLETGVPLIPRGGERRNGSTRNNLEAGRSIAPAPATECRTRVFVAAENRLLQDALSRMLAKRSDIEVAGTNTIGPFEPEVLRGEEIDVLLLTSRGTLAQDILANRKVRAMAPEIQILLIGVSGDEIEFLQYVRAGIQGYLMRDASAEDVIAGIRAIRAGEAICPGTLNAILFRYLEREATAFPSASVHQRMGLTRREQQLIPLIAQGLTNKEIANHFCLSEQTVKNHLYRM